MARRPTQLQLLVLLYAVSALFCLAGAARPMAPTTPVDLFGTLGVVGLVLAGALWWAGRRWPVPTTHAGFALMSLLVALVAARSVTAVGVVGLGPDLIALGLYASHFFSARAARLQIALLVCATSLGAALAVPSGFRQPWIIAVAATIALAEAHGGLSRQLRTAATTDALTGLANRRAWEVAAAHDLARAGRAGRPVTIAILDLDSFKDVNDTRGHGAGDELLRDLANRWAASLRRSDLLGRYGGDEFVLSLPDTDERGALEILDRLEESHPAPWSVGTATSDGVESLASVLARADAALYAHKHGRSTGKVVQPTAHS
ncbi:MAG: putative diguanylate cyclase [Mycobacterium sp.]|jgi:diguanylate cyclase (GGDEF)-like protein|nr:putative diguanylate cyclase [Mycobacterium sp.]